MLAGEANDDYMIVDGVGSKGTALNPTPGTFDIYTFNKLPKSNAPNLRPYQTTTDILDHNVGPRVATPPPPHSSGWNEWFKNWYDAVSRSAANQLRPIANKKTYLEGILKGQGMDDNMRHAVAVWVSRHTYELCGDWPERFKINIIGWSRGAITAIRTANYFSEMLRDRAEIHLFAFDPVPGGERCLDDERKIGSSVRSYVSILCMHERRESFHPVDMTGKPIRRLDLSEVRGPLELVLLPMAGVHSTPLYFAHNKSPVHLHRSAEIGRYLAWKFLRLKGTIFKTGDDEDNRKSNFTAARLCEKYAEIMLNLKAYAGLDPKFTTAAQSILFGALSATRAVLTDRQSYLFRLGKAELFLNEHHFSAFLKAYPSTALARNLSNRVCINRQTPDVSTAKLLAQYPTGSLRVGDQLVLQSSPELPSVVGGRWCARHEANWYDSFTRGQALLDKLMG
jgi:hypothetical protein